MPATSSFFSRRAERRLPRHEREDAPVTKIFLVDDHPLFRAGIRQSLAPFMEFCIVGEAGSARDAFVAIDTHRPDIVLMDVALPGMDGVIATREVRRRTPRTRVLIFSVHDQIGDVLDALDAGASGYALKTEGTDALVAALRCVLRNDRYVAPSLSPRLASYESRRTKPADTLSILSVQRARGVSAGRRLSVDPRDRPRAVHLPEDGRHALVSDSPKVGIAHFRRIGQACVQSRPDTSWRRARGLRAAGWRGVGERRARGRVGR